MAIYDATSERIIARIVYDGPPGAGKSTNVERLCSLLKVNAPPAVVIPGAPRDDPQARVSWLEFRAEKVGKQWLDCQIVAVPSSERYLRIRPHLYRTADLVVLVADSTAAEASRLQRHSIALRTTGRDRNFVVQANKQDLPGALPPTELVARLGLPPPLQVFSAEAVHGVGVKETLHGAVHHCADALRAVLDAGRLSTLAGSAESIRQLRDVLALYSSRTMASDHGRALSAHLRELAASRVSGVATVAYGVTSALVTLSEGMLVHVEYPAGDTSVEDSMAEQLGLDPAAASTLKAEARTRGEPLATLIAARRLAPGPRVLQALQSALRARLSALVGEMNPRFRHEFAPGPQRAARGLLIPLDTLLATEEPTTHHPTKEQAMSAETIMKRTMKDVPKCVAAGVVDLDSGMLLNVKTVDSHPQEVLDLVAAATRDLYEGDNVTAIENMFKRVRGVKSDEHYFQQIIVMSRNLVHFFGRLASNQRIVLVAVCRADANLGLVLAQGRAICSSESL